MNFSHFLMLFSLSLAMASPSRSLPAKFSPESMTLIAVLITTAALLLQATTTAAAVTAKTIDQEELETAITTLRYHG